VTLPCESRCSLAADDAGSRSIACLGGGISKRAFGSIDRDLHDHVWIVR
jgi:hypothetical protein